MIRDKGERKRKSGSVKGKSVNKANDFIHRGPFHRFHSIAVTVIDTTDGHGKSVRRLRFDFEGKSDCMIAWPSNGNRTSSNIPGSRSSDRVIGVVKKTRAREKSSPTRKKERFENDEGTIRDKTGVDLSLHGDASSLLGLDRQEERSAARISIDEFSRDRFDRRLMARRWTGHRGTIGTEVVQNNAARTYSRMNYNCF